MHVIEALEKLEKNLVLADQRRRPRELFQVGSSQRLLFVEAAQSLKRTAPRVLSVKLVGLLQRRRSLQRPGHGFSFPIAELSDKDEMMLPASSNAR